MTKQLTLKQRLQSLLSAYASEIGHNHDVLIRVNVGSGGVIRTDIADWPSKRSHTTRDEVWALLSNVRNFHKE